MSDVKKKPEKKHIRVVLSNLISRYRIPLLIFFGIVIVSMIGVAVYSAYNQNSVEKSSIAAEELQSIYDEWSSAAEDEKADLKTELLQKAELAANRYSRLFAAQRAYLITGRVFYAEEEWEKSIEQFKLLAEKFPKSYLAPVSLMSAAAAYEQLEDYESSIELYNRIGVAYAESFPSTAYALISMGRLYEKLNDRIAAIETYNQVIDNFSGSSWTNIAQNRIIYLETLN